MTTQELAELPEVAGAGGLGELLALINGRADLFTRRQDGRWFATSVINAPPADHEALGIDDRGALRALPEWARYYLAIGRQTAEIERDESTVTTLGLVVPTRAYAAALVAVGHILSTAHLGDLDPTRWFKQLTELPPGTAVTIRDGDRLRKAEFSGVRSIDGREYLVLKQGGETRHLPAQACLRVTPALTRRGTVQTGSISFHDRDFLAALMPALDPLDFVRRSNLHCVILGGVNEFRAEVLDATFAVRTESHAVLRGRLQAVLRVARLVGKLGQFRSELIAGGERLPVHLGHPTVLIINGAEAYLRREQGQVASEATRVVLIARSEKQADEATNALLAAYAQRAGESPRLAPSSETGIDILAFQEQR